MDVGAAEAPMIANGHYSWSRWGIRFLTGLLSFFAICSVGVIANVGIAAAVFQQHYAWWLSALAGIAVGLVWNYAVSSVFTWRRAC